MNKIFKTVFVFVLTGKFTDFYSFKNFRKSKQKKKPIFSKSIEKNRKNTQSKAFSFSNFILPMQIAEKKPHNKKFPSPPKF